jgi:hypothetical protein
VGPSREIIVVHDVIGALRSALQVFVIGCTALSIVFIAACAVRETIRATAQFVGALRREQFRHPVKAVRRLALVRRADRDPHRAAADGADGPASVSSAVSDHSQVLQAERRSESHEFLDGFPYVVWTTSVAVLTAGEFARGFSITRALIVGMCMSFVVVWIFNIVVAIGGARRASAATEADQVDAADPDMH